MKRSSETLSKKSTILTSSSWTNILLQFVHSTPCRTPTTPNFPTVMISSSVVKKSCPEPNVSTNQHFSRNAPKHGVLTYQPFLLTWMHSEMELFPMVAEVLEWNAWLCFIWDCPIFARAVCSPVTLDELPLK